MAAECDLSHRNARKRKIDFFQNDYCVNEQKENILKEKCQKAFHRFHQALKTQNDTQKSSFHYKYPLTLYKVTPAHINHKSKTYARKRKASKQRNRQDTKHRWLNGW